MNSPPQATVEATVRRLTLIPLALVLALSAGQPTAAARSEGGIKLNYFERLSLANWRMVMRVDRSSKYWQPTGMLLISSPPAKVMGTFMDFNKQSGFMPKVKSSRIVRRRGKQELWVLVILTLPWPVANAWVAVKYNWTRTPDGAYHMHWVRHRGSMNRYWGTMSLLPWGKHWTLAVCTQQAVPDAHVSRSRLNNGIVWGTEQVLHHLRAEVDRRRKRGALKAFAP